MSHLFPIEPACFWLVVALLFVFGGCLRPWCIFFLIFSVAQFDGPNNEITSTSTPTNGGGGSGGMTTVAAAAVLATRQQIKQRQQQQHNNNTTTNTTTNKTANMEGESLSSGKEPMCETMFFFSVQVCLSPWTVLRQSDLRRYLLGGWKGMFLGKIVKISHN
jgi:hypothetical protein